MPQWWSWGLMCGTAASMWYAKKSRHGWLAGAFLELAWASYGFLSQQWGFVFGAVLFGFVYTRNWLR